MSNSGLMFVLAAAASFAASAQSYNIATVAGSDTVRDGSPATSALLRAPQSVAMDSAGNLYIADAKGNRVRKVSTKGIITTVAGIGLSGFAGDGGPATAAPSRFPFRRGGG